MHFTYECPVERFVLRQGDILFKTDAIKDILKDVHPHYLKDDYTHLIVLTQSCDLEVRNGSSCKASYITVAAIRPFKIVVDRLVGKFQKDPISRILNICDSKSKETLIGELKKLLNNQVHDYFFLCAEPIADLEQDSCAFLRLSVALKTKHYDDLVEARILSLTETFQAKLGWLVGNIYSRVGTQDWAPEHCTEGDFDKRAHDILVASCKWHDKQFLDEAKKYIKNIVKTKHGGSYTAENVTDALNSFTPRNKKEEVICRVVEILRNNSIITQDYQEKMFRNLCTSDSKISSILK